jgi:hypothetical protein
MTLGNTYSVIDGPYGTILIREGTEQGEQKACVIIQQITFKTRTQEGMIKIGTIFSHLRSWLDNQEFLKQVYDHGVHNKPLPEDMDKFMSFWLSKCIIEDVQIVVGKDGLYLNHRQLMTNRTITPLDQL